MLVGSGVDKDNAASLLEHAHGAIVGTNLKVDGVVSNPVDPERVRRLARLFQALSRQNPPPAAPWTRRPT